MSRILALEKWSSKLVFLIQVDDIKSTTITGAYCIMFKSKTTTNKKTRIKEETTLTISMLLEKRKHKGISDNKKYNVELK
ncbi:TPA: hypothetical protein NKS71_002031 [Vibrio parahaemolyticus]|uniref:hypothetical protein n=1 Tax=Vibrio harveyi group TaxID=717610 RepID=UPI001021951D|nr:MULTISPECIES: hypothetical protein [Vibrio harveyi group]EHJ9982702.1 hypothetical protein [Vibrio parahaemolyticus]MBM4953191.1 hypothetical protein [Vibrio parahaemolyticus]HCE2073815.1 hypothetical protein [Vibrio parahaemolyticus]HCH2580822.1 hypothetical protein [Vibrio parahaemolyticus]HCH5311933.1 hypothetical protein [Vibrio parahaemolyticus]